MNCIVIYFLITVLILLLVILLANSKMSKVSSDIAIFGGSNMNPNLVKIKINNPKINNDVKICLTQNIVTDQLNTIKSGDFVYVNEMLCKVKHVETHKNLTHIFKNNVFPMAKNVNDLCKYFGIRNNPNSKYTYFDFEYQMENELMRRNYHVAQREYYGKKYGIEFVDDLEVNRILDLNTENKGIPYHSRKHEPKTVLHWGQLKLMLSEIEFLTVHAPISGGDVVLVYPGSAGGHHIPFMSKLFPNVKFILYDPLPYAIKPDNKIEIYNEYFTDESAAIIKAKLRNAKLLLVSDIRSNEVKDQTHEEVEKTVKFDQALQMSWYDILQPDAAMFKFRLPWDNTKTTYLEGKIYLPIFGPKTTTETRLWIGKDAKKVEYDNMKYENLCFEFNIKQRTQLYKTVANVDSELNREGFCRCYDCAAEMMVLRDYLLMKNSKCSDVDIFKLAYEISENMSKYHIWNYHKTLNAQNFHEEE